MKLVHRGAGIGAFIAILEIPRIWFWGETRRVHGLGFELLAAVLEIAGFAILGACIAWLFNSKGPGKYLLLMMWWVFLGFAFILIPEPIYSNLTSYNLFFVAFALTILIGFLLNIADSRLDYWNRTKHWGKYAILAGSYTLNAAANITILINLPSELITYFHMDAGGSIGLLYLPTVIFYVLAGLVISICLTIRNVVHKKKQPLQCPSAKNSTK